MYIVYWYCCVWSICSAVLSLYVFPNIYHVRLYAINFNSIQFSSVSSQGRNPRNPSSSSSRWLGTMILSMIWFHSTVVWTRCFLWCNCQHAHLRSIGSLISLMWAYCAHSLYRRPRTLRATALWFCEIRMIVKTGQSFLSSPRLWKSHSVKSHFHGGPRLWLRLN